ncbi:Oxidative stress 3 [Quillaja saponaria]|uniref:Oxidative stress 3 n=1 Tax=Quillaja saponaria TaxID=32244 RepID=A0AAD7PKC7_QUISA|nr:Oxidative stress 3 [Quillaja saponaria]
MLKDTKNTRGNASAYAAPAEVVKHDNQNVESLQPESIISCSDCSSSSIGSVSSSEELLDDTSSSFPNEPMFKFSQLLAQLPIKQVTSKILKSLLSLSCTSKPCCISFWYKFRVILLFTCRKGLSMYYQGKSRTFTTLSDVRCIEDLAKREIPYRKRGRANKSPQSPKAIISKKAGKCSLMAKGRLYDS